MSAYAAWGFVALAWWTWPLLFAVVMAAMVGGLWVQEWLERRRKPGPVRQCGELVGITQGQFHVWCNLPGRHASSHQDQYGLSPEQYRE